MMVKKYITIVGSLNDFPAKEDVEIGDRLVLKIDSENRDPYAIAVYNMDEEKVGYVSARTSTTLHGCLKNREIHDICRQGDIEAVVEEIICRENGTVFKACIDEYEEYPGENEEEDIMDVVTDFYEEVNVEDDLHDIEICQILTDTLTRTNKTKISFTAPSGRYIVELSE